MPYQDISQRYSTRAQAERYRDRFRKGRRYRTHERETAALRSVLAELGTLDTVLDVGSGPGRFVSTFMEYASRLIQADFSTNMLHVSRDDYPLKASEGAYVQADVRLLPFADNSCDVVFSHRLLNHLSNATDRDRALAEAARITKRFVVISCLCSPFWLRALHRFWRRLRRREAMGTEVYVEDVLGAAHHAGLVAFKRTPIRSFLRSAAFFILTKRTATSGQTDPHDMCR